MQSVLCIAISRQHRQHSRHRQAATQPCGQDNSLTRLLAHTPAPAQQPSSPVSRHQQQTEPHGQLFNPKNQSIDYAALTSPLWSTLRTRHASTTCPHAATPHLPTPSAQPPCIAPASRLGIPNHAVTQCHSSTAARIPPDTLKHQKRSASSGMMFRRSHIRSGPGRAVWSAICNMSASCGAKLMLILRDNMWLMNPMSTSLLRILPAQVHYSMSKPAVPRFLLTIRGINRSRSAFDPWHSVLSLNVAAKTASQHVIIITLFPCRVHDGLRANRHQVPSTAVLHPGLHAPQVQCKSWDDVM